MQHQQFLSVGGRGSWVRSADVTVDVNVASSPSESPSESPSLSLAPSPSSCL